MIGEVMEVVFGVLELGFEIGDAVSGVGLLLFGLFL